MARSYRLGVINSPTVRARPDLELVRWCDLPLFFIFYWDMGIEKYFSTVV